jgi:deoxyribodipyrimidine photo-lyase
MVAWFRNDLRVADNPLINIIAKYNQLQQQQNLGLTCTTDDGSSNSSYIPKYDVDLICLFCIDERYFKPTQHSPHKTGLFRSKFLIESVLNLRDNLKSKLGRSLLITTIPPEIIIPQLCDQSHDLYDVFVQAEVASEEVEIERRVENALQSLSPPLLLSSSPSRVLHRIIGGSTLYHPQDLPFRPDCSDLPNIFSDFRHALEQGPNKISIRPLLPTISADMLPVDVDDVHGRLSTAGTCGIDDDAWSPNHTDAPCSYEFVPTLLGTGIIAVC